VLCPNIGPLTVVNCYAFDMLLAFFRSISFNITLFVLTGVGGRWVSDISLSLLHCSYIKIENIC
jgi:hypothetical protein